MIFDALPPIAVEIAAAPEYVVGYPMHVWVVVSLQQRGAEIYDLPSLTPFAAEGLGIVLSRAGTGEVLWRAEPPPVGGDEPYDRFTLRGPERRRMLADLSPLLPATLTAGEYRLAVLYRGPLHQVESAPVEVAFRAPTEAEAQEVERLQPELRRARSWGAWTFLQPPEPLTGEVKAGDPLRFNRLVRALSYGPRPLRRDDLPRLDVLRGFYAPEAAALRAELLYVIGDRAGFHRAAADLVETYSDLAWRAAEIAADGSMIGWQRRAWDARGELPDEP